jgi:DNA-binding transcriptional LysR family regulator
MHRLATLLLLTVLVWATPSLAQDVAPYPVDATDRLDIREVIARQLEAFRRDDGDAAFAFASPGIQAIFRDPETFMAMVRAGYGPVYRPHEVEFRDIVGYRGQPTQRVLLVGPDNVPVVAYYLMERQPDGSWRIDGCILMGTSEAVT